MNILSIIVSSIILVYGLASSAPWNVKILLVIAIGVPLLCSIGITRNK